MSRESGRRGSIFGRRSGVSFQAALTPGKPTSRKADRAPRSDPYTEHPTREGKVYCCVVLDTYSRRVVGWSIDASPAAALVTNALGMAIDSRLGKTAAAGTVIHSDQLNSPSSRPAPSPTAPRLPARWPRWAASVPATTTR